MNFPVSFSDSLRRRAMPGGSRCLRIIGVLAVVAALQACSAVKLAYNQSIELAYLYLDGYADFNGAQSLKVKEELGKVLQWHRQTQLPAYIDTLQKLQPQITGDVQPQVVCNLFTDVRGKLAAITDKAEPSFATIAVMLEPRQLRHLEGKFDKLNAKYRDDYIDDSPRKLREKRMRLVVKRAEMLYGNLDAKQLAVIGKNLDESTFDAKKAYAEHLRAQRDVVQTLTPLTGGQTPPAQAQLAVHKLFERVLNSPDSAYRSYLDTFLRDNCEAFAELHNSTTTAQRNKAQQVLKNYEEDFRTLARQPS